MTHTQPESAARRLPVACRHLGGGPIDGDHRSDAVVRHGRRCPGLLRRRRRGAWLPCAGLCRDTAWRWRVMLRGVKLKGGLWGGLRLMTVAEAMRSASSCYSHDLLDPASLVACPAGRTLFVAGWKAVRWARPGIVFLIFMVPLADFLAKLCPAAAVGDHGQHGPDSNPRSSCGRRRKWRSDAA